MSLKPRISFCLYCFPTSLEHIWFSRGVPPCRLSSTENNTWLREAGKCWSMSLMRSRIAKAVKSGPSVISVRKQAESDKYLNVRCCYDVEVHTKRLNRESKRSSLSRPINYNVHSQPPNLCALFLLNAVPWMFSRVTILPTMWYKTCSWFFKTTWN